MICHKPWGVYKIIEIQTYMCQSSSTQLWEFSVPSTRRLLYNWVIDASRVYCFYFWLFYFDDNNNSNNGKCYTHTHTYKSCSELCLNMWIFQVTARCPAVCECPAEPPVCPPGVSSVSDRCGCCKVCAAQLNQDCSPARPCDHHKGLECNYGNDVTMAWGICRGEKTMNAGREEISEEGGKSYIWSIKMQENVVYILSVKEKPKGCNKGHKLS